MLEIKGKFNDAKVFTDSVDEASLAQIQELCDQEFVAGSRIRLMPDVHAGMGCTIGTTMTVTDKIVPNLVGVDIGCGMETMRLAEKDIDLELLDKVIHERVPAGFNIRPDCHEMLSEAKLSSLVCAPHVNIERAEKSIGTLGGGNHFIEANRDDEGNLYIVVHSGSRHLGLEVANHYQKLAQESLGIRRRKLPKPEAATLPSYLAYLTGDLFDDYVHDMKIVQHFAVINRKAMVDEILRGMNLHAVEEFTTIHNYLDTDHMILRKGAVSAMAGEKLLIPINMRDGSLVCVGKGNEDWNCSAPHGAGRLMSRKEARKRFTVDEFEREMTGVYSTSVGQKTIDECPMAYKSMESILENIGPTVHVLKVVKPVYNFKAGD